LRSACLSVCLLAHLENHTSEFHEIFCTCYLWQWLGPPRFMDDVMFSHNGANGPESSTALRFDEFARWRHRGQRCCLRLQSLSQSHAHFNHMSEYYYSPFQECHTQKMHSKQGVALTGRNRTGPPCSVGRPTARPPDGDRPPRRPARRQSYRRRRQTTASKTILAH